MEYVVQSFHVGEDGIKGIERVGMEAPHFLVAAASHNLRNRFLNHDRHSPVDG